MTLTEIINELYKLQSDRFEDSENNELIELKKMTLPKAFVNLYKDKTPIDSIVIGRFNLLRLQDLINENIWDSPGDELYDLGFPIIGTDPDGMAYCLNMNEKNKLNDHDLLLVDLDEEYAEKSAREARKGMKFINGSLEVFLNKEFEFLKKGLKKKVKA